MKLPITHGVILAAGKNTRFDTGIPKSLQKLGPVTLLERQIHQMHAAGLTHVAVVAGFRGEQIVQHLESLAHRIAHPVTVLWNHQFEKANAWSILSAESFVGTAPFVVSMSDHVFSDDFLPTFLRRSQSTHDASVTLVLGVDLPGDHNQHIDLEDVTKVWADHNLIRHIGKHLTEYNYFDTGCFLLQTPIFDAIRSAMHTHGDSISHAVTWLSEQKKAGVCDVSRLYWNDVDTPADFHATLTQLAISAGSFSG